MKQASATASVLVVGGVFDSAGHELGEPIQNPRGPVRDPLGFIPEYIPGFDHRTS